MFGSRLVKRLHACHMSEILQFPTLACMMVAVFVIYMYIHFVDLCIPHDF